MLPLLSVVSLAKKAYNFRKARKNGGEKDFTEVKPKTPMTATGKLRLFIVLPLILTGIGFILSVLCVYAGSKPGMMDDYAVFTLNTSRIGENVLADINDKISAVDIKLKREEMLTMTAPVALITPAPTTMLTVMPRDFMSEISEINSKASSKVNSAKSNIESKASSAQSAAESAASSAISSAKDKVLELVNKSFRAAIEGMDLSDVYNVHISSSCVGTYVYKDGKNYTASDSSHLDELRPNINSCESHSAVNPFQLVRIIYWVGVVLSAIALVVGVIGVIKPTKKMALVNVVGTLPAVVFMGLSSAVSHGMAVGAAHLVTFVGEKIGITGVAGQKFIQLTWATTVLLLISLCLWAVVFYLVRRMEKAGGDRKRVDRTSTIAMNHWAPQIPRPMPAHTDKNGHAMI